MAKLIITDGVALLKLSRAERIGLGRRYIAFDLNQVLRMSVEETPSKDALGKKTKFSRLSFSDTGEYQDGSKISFVIGPNRDRCIKLMLLNPEISEMYLTFGNQFKVFASLAAHQRAAAYPRD